MLQPEKLLPSTTVRYIKLGEGGKWGRECEEEKIIRIGFNSADEKIFSLCKAGRWKDLVKYFSDEGRNKGTATNFTNQLEIFFKDKGDTLWITFMNQKLYWGFMEDSPCQKHASQEGIWRKIKNGWSCLDLSASHLPLHQSLLAGGINKLQGFRGTTCRVKDSEQVIRRINGDVSEEQKNAIAAREHLKSCLPPIITTLNPKDFEILVALVFDSSGWQRQGAALGGTQKTLDLDLILPTTGERAFVQTKCETNSKELESYITKLMDLDHDRIFYVYHTCSSKLVEERTLSDNKHVTIIDADKLSDMIIDAGLVNWVINHSK